MPQSPVAWHGTNDVNDCLCGVSQCNRVGPWLQCVGQLQNMNTNEIQCTLYNVSWFHDVYSIHTLPSQPKSLMMCNLDPSHHPGTHWIVVYPSKRLEEYFYSMVDHRVKQFGNISVIGGNNGLITTVSCRVLSVHCVWMFIVDDYAIFWVTI